MDENGKEMDTKVAKNWQKFRLLIWKNFLLQYRRKSQTVVQILVPVVFSLLLVFIRSRMDPETFPNSTLYSNFSIDNLDSLRENNQQPEPPIRSWKLVYTPQNRFFEAMVDEVVKSLKLDGSVSTPTPKALEKIMALDQLVAGIEFHHSANITELPKKLSYSLRFPSELRISPSEVPNWQTSALFSPLARFGPRNQQDNDGGSPFYYREGFVSIQDAVARAFVKVKSNQNDSMPEVRMQRLPYPPYDIDIILDALIQVIPIFILISFNYSFSTTVRFIAMEKEKQLKEAMKIMGLPNWLHWLGWFIKSMVLLTITITIMVALLKIPMFGSAVSIFTYSTTSVVWMFFFVYIISITTFCFAMSVFFSKTNTAVTVAGLMWFISYLPYMLTNDNYAQLSFFAKFVLCLPSNSAMAYGIQHILQLERASVGLKWSNLFRPVSAGDGLTVGVIMALMLLSSFIYLMIALYVEKVRPGNFGVAEPWYFPLTKEFWFGLPEYHGVEDVPNGNSKHNRQDFEADPDNRHAGVRVMNLRKVYANQNVAVHGLTMNMFEDQITVLLGHNGAGKTTTMSVLTGMLRPSTGTAIINGYDIRKSMDKARESLGLCPQHNILFDDMTVGEHLEFYCRLKGLDGAEVTKEVNRYVKLLDFESKINALSSTLSGGMKRKLSVGIALCGGSKVVLCDEPSSGMDPAARRSLWDLLQMEKKGRTILLSTHFMDEADILGDRIAIMADGYLKCTGSSFFLKKRFGTGYHLICVKNERCMSHKVTELLAKYIPNIEIESDIGTELSYQLPEAQVGIFEEMFIDLENQRDALQLGGYGVSLTTLEEVFLKVGSDSFNSDHRDTTDDSSNGNSVTENGDTATLLSGLRLQQNQWLAMMKKRLIYWMRNWKMFFLQNLIPFVYVVMSVLVVRSLVKSNVLPPLEITLQSYPRTVTLLENSTSTPHTNLTSRIISEYGKNVLAESNSAELDVTSQTIQTYFLEVAKTVLVNLNTEYLAGATMGQFANGTIIAWFNGEPYHAAPLSMNLVHNAIVRAMFGADHSIQLTNNPLPFNISTQIAKISDGSNLGSQLATNISLGMAFGTAFFILFYIKERVCRAKLLQFVSGANVFTFWFTSYLWDFCTFIVMALVLIITLASFQEEGWSTAAQLLRTFVVLIFFGFAALPITFIASMWFTVPSSGYTGITVINILTGMVAFLVINIMALPVFDLADWVSILKAIFRAFPHYALSSSLSNLNYGTTLKQTCESQCNILPNCTPENLCAAAPKCCAEVNYFEWEDPGISRNLTYMLGTGIVCFALLMIIEYRLLASVFYSILRLIRRQLPPETQNLDDDIVAEKQRVNAMSEVDIGLNNLVIRKMSKFYGKFLAVNQISIAVKSAECFGLLGVNGAGKTTTFKMLTGDERISDGDAWVQGISLKNDMNKAHKIIGYCPQFDALLKDLTGRETLEMFALLRGVPRPEINRVSLRLAFELNFIKHLDKRVSAYSGGNKRKLSTAVALLGDPSVVYLDEPTTGMDPGAKRNLWNMICKVRNSGKAIVLTSHSMEECEALCSRIAIMVNGEFKCLGSTQHLKNKFSKGYVLTVKVKKSSEANNNESTIEENAYMMTEMQTKALQLKDYIVRNFPGATIKEEFQGIITYYVPPQNDLKWSRMFGLMEDAKKTLCVEDYSISQTSLEEVFLSFAKNQAEDLRIT